MIEKGTQAMTKLDQFGSRVANSTAGLGSPLKDQ